MIKKIILLPVCLSLMGGPVFSIDFSDLVAQIENSYNVRTALLDLEQNRGEIDLMTHPGDIVFSLDPSLKVVTEESESFGGEIALSGAASVKIPLALSAVEKEKLSFSLSALKAKEAAVETAKNDTYIKLFSLYQNIWLLQQEERLLVDEQDAAEVALRSAGERYALGSLTLKALEEAGDDLESVRTDLLENQLSQRVSWFELRSLTGLEEDPVPLAKIVLEIDELPKPPELYDWMIASHPLLKAEREKLNQLVTTLSRLKKADLDMNVKAFFNSVGNNLTASINFDIMDPVLTPSIGFPVYTFVINEIPSSSGGTATWNTGLTFNLSLGTGKSDRLSGEGLELEIEKTRLRIEYLSETVNLALRSAYQQHVRNMTALEEAERNLSLSRDNRKVVEARKELNQVSELDLIVSGNAVTRSEWKIEAARINLEKSWLALLNIAVKLNTDELAIREGGDD
ncbi:MAG: TolC family protein [Spirochaetales bacterium]|nr:TolC family protein [Spirochaetales bacterium]